MGWGERIRAGAAILAVLIVGMVIIGIAILWLAIHGWTWLDAHNMRAHGAAYTTDTATANTTARNTTTPPPSPPRTSSSSPESATGHMPPWHHGLIHGTKRDDVLSGTESGERIEALAGRDRIMARGGNDELDGGADADVLMGGVGDDTYIVQHHGGGADILLEESGTDTLRLAGGRIDLVSIEILRHGDDLLVRWAHDRPGDAVLIRSWFAGSQYHIEHLELPDGTHVPLEPLAARARTATSEDTIHFPTPPPSIGPARPR